jgi:hypothetical protein
MKTAILLTTIMVSAHALAAATSVNCIVQKFDPKQGYNFSDDSTQVFKGPVSDQQYLLIDEKGRVTLVKRTDSFEGIDITKTQLVVAQGLADLVIVAQAQKQVSAFGKNSAILVDQEKGTAVTCSSNPLP